MAKIASKKKAADPKQKGSVPAAVTSATDTGSYLFPALIETTEQLFISDLRETYWAENHLVTAIPKMIAAAGANELKEALTDHLAATITHVTRLEQVFELLGADPLPKKCAALEGLAISGENIIQSTKAGTAVRDTGIISAGIKVENFETVTYEGLIRAATQLGLDNVISVFQETLNEEIEAGDLLTSLAENDKDPS